jgi:hypothetical protein
MVLSIGSRRGRNRIGIAVGVIGRDRGRPAWPRGNYV